YFINNRIENLKDIAGLIQRLVPDARVITGHGQMDGKELEARILDFMEGKYDVLVSTTIVESGVDVPNANTIFINDAQRFGMADLHQMRGRVGRSNRKAFCYLITPPFDMMTSDARKRLEAIEQFSDLGSGFQIAMKDLEIRGAGNLLGAEQHGQIAQVGFDLYCQLLSQAISELKGEEVEEVTLPPVDLPFDAYIPNDYITSEAQRIFFYKKMAAAKSMKDVQQVQEEMDDRFGDPPRAVWNMLAVLRLRIRAAEFGIGSIATEKRQIIIKMSNGFRILPDIAKELQRTYKRHWFQPEKVVLNPENPRILDLVEDMVEIVGKALKKSARKMQVA
ncbi:MAG TPA: helicase-related protein, partial [Armatimonadota bacterium]|nr:helicase-related protein [Armatimonadota bacterium]